MYIIWRINIESQHGESTWRINMENQHGESTWRVKNINGATHVKVYTHTRLKLCGFYIFTSIIV